ncbi:MAG: GntR family transcriptional regulator [Sumerlaeia bacterium]
MFFEVDLQGGKPVYQQMIDQAKYAIASGRLRAGDRLPSVREAAVALRVNRNTVSRVYSELEREGLVYSRPGQGSFVSERATGSDLSAAFRREQLAARADDLLAQAKLFHFNRDETMELISARAEIVFGSAPHR